MKKLFLFSILISVNSVFAATTSDESTVKQITIEDTYARIKLVSMTSLEGCLNQEYYYLDLSEGKNSGVLSVVLTAKATQSQIKVQAKECVDNYPSISHIYLN